MEEVEEMRKAIESGRFWGGPYVERFEKELAKYLNVRRAVFCNSGSSALFLAVSALHLPKETKVVTQALAFPTAVNALVFNGLKPVFVDVELDTLNVNPDTVLEAVRQSPPPKPVAYLHTHTIGNCPDMKKMKEVVDGIPEQTWYSTKDNPKVEWLEKFLWIEDACDNFGSKFAGKHLGTYADISCTSFHPAHAMTCGLGGACFTDNNHYAERMLMLRDWGRINQKGLKDRFIGEHDMRYFYPERGFNMQATEVMAAMGCVQLTRLDGFNQIRRRNFKMLLDFFSKYKDLFILPKEHPDAWISWFGYPVIRNPELPWSEIDEEAKKKTWRQQFMEAFEEKGIQCRSIYGGTITRQPGYRYVDYMQHGDLKNSEYLSKNAFWIGCYHGLSEEQIKQMCERIEAVLSG